MKNLFFDLFSQILTEEDGGGAGMTASGAFGAGAETNMGGTVGNSDFYAKGDARNLFGGLKGEGGSKYHPNTKKHAKTKGKRKTPKAGKRDMSGKASILFTQRRMFPSGY